MRVHEPGADEFAQEWWVWVGRRKDWVFSTEDQALEHARSLAVKGDRPAWLLDSTGYPLKPIALD